jgi:hypothetical protein
MALSTNSQTGYIKSGEGQLQQFYLQLGDAVSLNPAGNGGPFKELFPLSMVSKSPDSSVTEPFFEVG